MDYVVCCYSTAVLLHCWGCGWFGWIGGLVIRYTYLLTRIAGNGCAGRLSHLLASNTVTRNMRTDFEMGTDGMKK